MGTVIISSPTTAPRNSTPSETFIPLEQEIPSGITAFIDLTDVPASYTGQTGKMVAVNATENALEFAVPPSGATTFIGLTDAPASYTGQTGKIVAVNATENALEFISPPTGGAATTDILMVQVFS